MLIFEYVCIDASDIVTVAVSEFQLMSALNSNCATCAVVNVFMYSVRLFVRLVRSSCVLTSLSFIICSKAVFVSASNAAFSSIKLVNCSFAVVRLLFVSFIDAFMFVISSFKSLKADVDVPELFVTVALTSFIAVFKAAMSLSCDKSFASPAALLSVICF